MHDMPVPDNYGYIKETEELVKNFFAISVSFWHEHPEIHHRYKPEDFLGEGYIVHYDIYGNLCGSDELIYFYKRNV